MNTDALLAWAADLRATGARLKEVGEMTRWSMGDWGVDVKKYIEKSGYRSPPGHFRNKDNLTCGFAGCAYGWAVQNKVFEPFGLKLVMKAPSENSTNLLSYTEDGQHYDSNDLAGDLDMDDGAMDLIVLFENYDTSDITVEIVADRIEELTQIGEEAFIEKYKVERED